MYIEQWSTGHVGINPRRYYDIGLSNDNIIIIN